MELKSTFRINGVDTISNELVVPINWQNAFINLSFDKDSVIAKSKGVVSTTEWEWISKTAKFLSDYQKEGITGGFGVLVGIPFQWELTDDNQRQIIFDGYLDLSNAIFECDKVTAPSRERKQIDDLNSKVDSFTYEYLLSLGRLTPSDYSYVPYAKLPVQNLALELVLAITQLTILIIELVQAISTLVKHIQALVVFSWPDLLKAITHQIYCLFLMRTVSQAITNIIKLIIQPIKYHAGMTELRLMQVGAEYLGYDFKSNILEDQFPNAVIIPEKWNIPENPDDELITGFTGVNQMINLISSSTNHTNQQGYFNGTFGDVIRILKTKYNAKIVIEESTTGGNQIMRLEREDYIGDINALYEIPAIDNNDTFRLNSDEFNANYLIEYQLDSINRACYLDYGGTILQATISANNFDDEGLVLMTGLETKSIGLAKGSRKNTLTRVETAVGPLLDTVDTIIGDLVFGWNETMLDLWFAAVSIIDTLNDIINFLNNVPGGGLNINPIDSSIVGSLDSMPFIPLPVRFGGDRTGVMQVESDFLNIPHNVILAETAEAVVISPNAFSLENFPANGELVDLTPYFSSQSTTGDFLSNRLVENHSFEIGSKNLYQKFHYINSFVPTDVSDTDENPLTPQLHNQWKLYEFENVPFCIEDYLKVKNNNNIIFVDKVGRIESLEWDVYNQTAKISFRINELWTNNLEINYNEPIGR